MEIEEFILKWAPHLAPEEELYRAEGENLLSTVESEEVVSQLREEFVDDFFALFAESGFFQKWCAPKYQMCRADFVQDALEAIRTGIFLG